MRWALLLGCGLLTREHHRSSSPDGRFDVVVRASALPRLAGPGQGSDMPGEVELVRRSDGRSCGALPVELVLLADDLRWTPTSADLPAIGSWDLTSCTVIRAP